MHPRVSPAPPITINRLGLYLCLLTTILLHGCARMPDLAPLPDEHRSPHPPTSAAEARNWFIDGKLGIRMPNKSGSVYFAWRQYKDQYAMHFTGPLGQGSTAVKGNKRRVVLENADGKLTAATPEALIEESLGWQLPVSQLVYWVRGVPAPDARVQTERRDANGQLQYLQQHGWQIHYQRFRQVGALSMPDKIIAERNGIRLTFIIKQWQIL